MFLRAPASSASARASSSPAVAATRLARIASGAASDDASTRLSAWMRATFLWRFALEKARRSRSLYLARTPGSFMSSAPSHTGASYSCAWHRVCRSTIPPPPTGVTSSSYSGSLASASAAAAAAFFPDATRRRRATKYEHAFAAGVPALAKLFPT